MTTPYQQGYFDIPPGNDRHPDQSINYELPYSSSQSGFLPDHTPYSDTAVNNLYSGSHMQTIDHSQFANTTFDSNIEAFDNGNFDSFVGFNTPAAEEGFGFFTPLAVQNPTPVPAQTFTTPNFTRHNSSASGTTSTPNTGTPQGASTPGTSQSPPMPLPVEKEKRKRGRKRANITEEERKRRRLERGRVAANKCRAKKRDQEQKQQDHIRKIQLENAHLKMQIQAMLIQEAGPYREEVAKHIAMSCPVQLPPRTKIDLEMQHLQEKFKIEPQRDGNYTQDGSYMQKGEEEYGEEYESPGYG